MPDKSPLHRKLAEVAGVVERIPKTGHNVKQGYDFVETGVVADAIRKELAERGVVMAPESIDIIGDMDIPTRNEGRQRLLTIRVTWRITDAESGESITRQSIGEGADSGDKASYKAQTGAMKYALLTGFLISTGDDPEKEPAQRAPRPAAAARPPARPPARPAGRPSDDSWSGYFEANPPAAPGPRQRTAQLPDATPAPAEPPAPSDAPTGGLTRDEFGAWLTKARIPPTKAREVRLRTFGDVPTDALTEAQWAMLRDELEPLAI